MVIAGFQGGFDLAQAGADLFSKITPTGSGGKIIETPLLQDNLQDENVPRFSKH